MRSTVRPTQDQVFIDWLFACNALLAFASGPGPEFPKLRVDGSTPSEGTVRVLVVDDEPDIRLLHRLNLEGAGHEVLLAADGMKALERIRADRPDCVVLDMMMPGLDGWGVLEELQQRHDSTPIIVVSARSAIADIEHARAMGADGYLAKPFNANTLLDEVAKLASVPLPI